MNTQILIKTSLLAACCYVVSPVMASTADGQTPAEESVCDSLDGEGALRGLCNSYCEALDCDSDNPHASETACNKVASNFAKHAPEGVVLPCEKVKCPCEDQWNNALGTLYPLNSEQLTQNCYAFYFSADEYSSTSGYLYSSVRVDNDADANFILTTNNGVWQCLDSNDRSLNPEGNYEVTSLDSVSEDEYNACLTLLENRCP